MPGRWVVGLDLGGTKLLAGVVDERLEIERTVRYPVRGLSAGALLDLIVAAVEELRGAVAGPVVAAGLGLPSLIDHRRGVALMSVHLPLRDLPVGALVSERLGLPVVLDNDANAAALAEHRCGAARGCDHAVVLTVGTGIGGGLILDGRVYRGSIGAASEPGHLVVDADGPPCGGHCPNRGCLEALASGPALERAARRLAAEYPESPLAASLAGARDGIGPLVSARALAGDELARIALASIGRWLGVGVASLVNLLDPERVVVGGGLGEAGELLLEPARAELGRRVLPPLRERCGLVSAHFGAQAGVVGAALEAWESVHGAAEPAPGAQRGGGPPASWRPERPAPTPPLR